MSIRFLFVLLFSSLFCNPILPELSFREMMAMDLFKVEKNFSTEDQIELQKFESAYDHQISSKKESKQIPKVIHVIWIGPKEFPPKSIQNIASWIEHHSDWEIKFWTDQKGRPLPHEKMTRCMVESLHHPILKNFLEKTQNYGEKADLLRYVILLQEGGIYIDHDVNCLKSFDALNNSFDFYTFLEPPHFKPGYQFAFFPGNSLIASVPNHPIILNTIAYVESCWDKIQNQFPNPSDYFVRVIHRTFRAFVESVRKELNSTEYKNLVLPAGLFYSAEDSTDSEILYARHQFQGAWHSPEENYTSPNK